MFGVEKGRWRRGSKDDGGGGGGGGGGGERGGEEGVRADGSSCGLLMLVLVLVVIGAEEIEDAKRESRSRRGSELVLLRCRDAMSDWNSRFRASEGCR